MRAVNIANLPAAGPMSQNDGVLVMQNGSAVYMSFAELLTYIASASVETDTTLTNEGMAAEATATAAAIAAAIASVKPKYETLWKNAKPSAERTKLTISAGSDIASTFDKIYVDFIELPTDGTPAPFRTLEIPVVADFNALDTQICFHYGMFLYTRIVTVDLKSNTVTVSACMENQSTTGAAGPANDYLIPVAVRARRAVQ